MVMLQDVRLEILPSDFRKRQQAHQHRVFLATVGMEVLPGSEIDGHSFVSRIPPPTPIPRKTRYRCSVRLRGETARQGALQHTSTHQERETGGDEASWGQHHEVGQGEEVYASEAQEDGTGDK